MLFTPLASTSLRFYTKFTRLPQAFLRFGQAKRFDATEKACGIFFILTNIGHFHALLR